MVMEEAALANRREYQGRLEEARRKGLPAAAVGDRSMVEQKLRQLVHQLQEEKRQSQQHLQETEHTLQQVIQQSQRQVRELQEARERSRKLEKELQGAIQQAELERQVANLKVEKSLQQVQQVSLSVMLGAETGTSLLLCLLTAAR